MAKKKAGKYQYYKGDDKTEAAWLSFYYDYKDKRTETKMQHYRGEESIDAAYLNFYFDFIAKRKMGKYQYHRGSYKTPNKVIDYIDTRRTLARQSKFDGYNKEPKVERWWAMLLKKPYDRRSMTQPVRKPRYDPHEHEIWNY